MAYEELYNCENKKMASSNIILILICVVSIWKRHLILILACNNEGVPGSINKGELT